MKKFLTDVNLNNNRIVNLNNPIDQLDGVNKDFIDDLNVDNFDVYNYNYSSLLTDPPSSGEIRLNSLTFSSATQSYINVTDSNSFDSSDTLDNLYQNQWLRIQQKDDNSKFVIYEITNDTDNTSYHTLNINYIKESVIGGPDSNSDCVIIFENTFSFSGTTNGSGIVKDDNVSSTGTRILTDDGTFKEYITVKADTFTSSTVTASSYVVSEFEDHIFCDTTNNDISLELPSTNGKEYNITKTSDLNLIIISVTQSGLINNNSDLKIIYKNSTASLRAVEGNYWII
jgi:hypothetical protein